MFANDGPRILDEFRSLRWMPVQPKHLDYENAQMLLIGHNESALDKATVPQNEDQQEDKDEPKEEMEKLEHEDEIRVEHLKGIASLPAVALFADILKCWLQGDDAVFEDLDVNAKEYPSLQTSW